MPRHDLSESADGGRGGNDPIAEYSEGQQPSLRTICDALRNLTTECIPKAIPRVWHGSPVWFIDDNPVVGYSARAKTVNLLFWNGQAFDEPGLKPVGKHRAAEVAFRAAAEIDTIAIRRWLKKAKANVLDSKAYFKKLRESN
jgi:hypothetical protein